MAVLVAVVGAVDMIYTHLAAAIAGAVLSAVAAWHVQAWRYDAQLATLRASHSATLTGIAEKTTAAYDAAIKREREVTTTLAALDKQQTQELHNAQAETNRLRACVRAGTCGVRIIAQPAQCDRGSPSSPDATPSGVGDATIALDADAGSRVLDLRDAISTDAAALSYLQGYARQCAALGE